MFGTQFSQSETRDGQSAQGQYNVLLPDGRTQTVDYQADSKGFRPKIKYEGEAKPSSSRGKFCQKKIKQQALSTLRRSSILL